MLACRFVPGTYARGTLVGRVTAAINAVLSLATSGTPGAGDFKLTFRGFTTAAIAYNAAASAVRSALEALPSIGVGNIAATGGALGTNPVVLTGQGDLAGQS